MTVSVRKSNVAMTENGQRRPAMARGGLDRAAHRRDDPAWLAEAWSRARILVLSHGTVPVHAERSRLAFVGADAVPATADEALFLGVDDDAVPYFAVAGALPSVPDARPATLREVGGWLPDAEASLLATAVAMVNWHQRHRFSPATGAATSSARAGWERWVGEASSDADGDAPTTLWPRTDPAVIMLVHDGVAGDEGRCLLGSRSGGNWYSTLAGFVEPGESAEDAVAREVAEEVGLATASVSYVASQPWPFPGQLMLGFTAVADPRDPLTVDRAELSHARWFSRAELRGDAAPQLSPPISISHDLVMGWLHGR